jgi:hypothetical protein
VSFGRRVLRSTNVLSFQRNARQLPIGPGQEPPTASPRLSIQVGVVTESEPNKPRSCMPVISGPKEGVKVPVFRRYGTANYFASHIYTCSYAHRTAEAAKIFGRSFALPKHSVRPIDPRLPCIAPPSVEKRASPRSCSRSYRHMDHGQTDTFLRQRKVISLAENTLITPGR